MEENDRPDMNLEEIPEEFHNHEGNVFNQCIMCGCDLFESGEDYFIERCIKKYKEFDKQDVIYEYATCSTCAEKMRKSMSVESLQRIEQYMFTHLTQNVQRIKMDKDEKMSACIIHGTPVQDMQEFTIQAHCRGNKLVNAIFPILIGEKAKEEMSELLSAQTKDEMDDFMDQYFTGPPEIREILRKRKVVII